MDAYLTPHVVCNTSPMQGVTILAKANYGVIFHKVGELDTTQEHWRHTFQVVLPDPSKNFQRSISIELQCTQSKGPENKICTHV